MRRRRPPPGPLPPRPGRVGPALQPPLGPSGAPAQVRGLGNAVAIGFDCDGSHNVVCTIFSCGGKGSARDENSDTVILFREPDAPINACAHAPLPLLFLSLIGSSKGSEKKDVTHSTWTDRMHRLYAGKLSEAQAGGGRENVNWDQGQLPTRILLFLRESSERHRPRTLGSEFRESGVGA